MPDYSVSPSSPPEEASLLEITQKLGPWQPGTYRGAGEVPIDTYIFVAYKLKDGKVLIFSLSAFLLTACSSDQGDWVKDVQSRTLEEREAFAQEYHEQNSYFQGSVRSQATFDTLIMIHPEHEAYYRQNLCL